MRSGLRALLVVAIAAALFLLWYFGSATWRLQNQRREIAGLPPDVRARMFASHKQEFDALCPSGSRLQEYCSNLAVVLDAFPECDAACHRQIDPWIPAPSR